MEYNAITAQGAAHVRTGVGGPARHAQRRYGRRPPPRPEWAGAGRPMRSIGASVVWTFALGGPLARRPGRAVIMDGLGRVLPRAVAHSLQARPARRGDAAAVTVTGRLSRRPPPEIKVARHDGCQQDALLRGRLTLTPGLGRQGCVAQG